MSEWITHRRPTEDDATAYCYEGLVWAYTKSGPRLYTWDQVEDHPWQPIDLPQPYAKPSRFEIYGAVGGWQVWGVRDNNGFDIIGFISRDHAKWAVEQLEKVIP